MEKYSEKLNDIAILQLDTQGFNELTEKQKNLMYHLSQAGLWGRFISLDQGSKYNIPLYNALITLYEKVEPTSSLYQELHDTLFTLFAHNGIYHSMSGEKLTLALKLDTLKEYAEQEPQLTKVIEDIIFSDKLPQFRTVQKEGVDVVQASGGNFYQNLTNEEVNHFRKTHYPQMQTDEVPPFGFNERLVKKNNGEIEQQIISKNGLYAKYVEKIITSLESALEFTENDKQHQSIQTLIDFYQTGSAFDFDKHCIAWTKDQESDIYFINGLIESYEDYC